MSILWKIGDRVTRPVVLDNGEWYRKGDACLKDSPLRHGEVVKVYCEGSAECIDVLWDSGDKKTYLPHGIAREVGRGA